MVAAGAVELGAAAGEDVGAGGREVGVLFAVGDAVGGAVVAGGGEDGDAEGGGRLAGGVEGVGCLGRPGGFRATPADGDDGRVVRAVVDGGADGVDEALVGVGSEVDDDVCAGGDGCGDFDVEHDFAVGTIGSVGLVLALVDGNGRHLRFREAEALEVGGDVGCFEAAAQLDEADGLAGGGEASRKTVELRNLHRCVRDVGGAGLRDAPVDGAGSDAEVRCCLGTIVEAEDCFNVACEGARNLDVALPDAVDHTLWTGLEAERDLKGFLQSASSPSKADNAAGRVVRGCE